MLSPASVALSVLSGLLSTLSPCVLPLLPIVFGSAATTHRFGVPALAAGLMTAFVAVGLFVATIGFEIGLDADTLRTISAILLALIGVILLSQTLQNRLALATGRVSNFGHRFTHALPTHHPFGQFLLGLLLGAIWSPCVGPTLGAASVLAAQGRNLPEVAIIMLAFGLGAALPLILVGALSRRAVQRWRTALIQTSHIGKYLLGASTLLVAALILTGWDHSLETILLDHTPDWLTRLTTAY